VLDGIENTISGPATMFRVDQAMAARAGFTPRFSRDCLRAKNGRVAA